MEYIDAMMLGSDKQLNIHYDGVSIRSLTKPEKLTQIDEEARELNRKARPVNYRVHLGHGIYASVSDGYMCVVLRRFYMPYGLQGEHNIRPTKEGLALRLKDEWSALLDLMPVIHAANPELVAAKLCCDNDDSRCGMHRTELVF